MTIDKVHIRHCMLYEFHLKKKNAVQATQSICSAYGDSVLDVQTCQNWFARFRSGNFDLIDKDRSGRPAEADDEKLEEILEEDPIKSTRELAIELAVSQTTVCNRLKALGKILKAGKWVPHQLSEINMANQLNTCVFLSAKRHHMSTKNSGSVLVRSHSTLQNRKFTVKRQCFVFGGIRRVSSTMSFSNLSKR